MVGFIQHASARFIGLQHAPDGHEYELYLNHVFPLMVSGSWICEHHVTPIYPDVRPTNKWGGAGMICIYIYIYM